MFPLWLAIVMIFYFLSGYSFWNLISIFYYCDYVTITQYHCIMIGQHKNNRTLYHQSEVKWKSLGHVWLFAAPWTVACQAPLPMEFSRQEYWSG